MSLSTPPLLICQSWLPLPYQSCTDLQPGFYFPFRLVCLFIVKRQMNILLDRQFVNILFCSYQGFFQKKNISCSLKEWKTVESISLTQMDIKLYDPPTIFALHTRLNIHELKLGIIWTIFPNFQNWACCKKICEKIMNTIASVLTQKDAWIFVLGHYLFLKAHSFLQATLCLHLGTDNVADKYPGIFLC